MTKISNVPISKSLLKKMAGVKMKDPIEVEIFLNNETEDREYIGLSGSGYVDFKRNSHLSPIQTTDKNIFSDNLKQLSPSEQANRANEKLKEISNQLRKQRIELSEKIFNDIAVKLHNIKLDNSHFNKDAGILRVKLSKSDILQLSKHPSLIYSIELPKGNMTLESAFDETRLNTTAYPVSQYGGDGVGIYMNEFGDTCFEQSLVEPVEDLIGLGGGLYTEDRPSSPDHHADVVAQSLRMASPESHIYCSDEYFSIPSNWKNQISVVNYSWWRGYSEKAGWSSYDTAADMHAYNDNVQLFISAGNGCDDDDDGNGKIECIIDTPAKSHNALTVGAYNDVTDSMGNFSDWNATGIHIEDSTYSDYTKPEILAPGVWLNSAGILNPEYNPPINSWSGTSFASPIAAGMAASMLSVPGLENIKSSQALMKAAVIAMATKDDISDNALSKRDGASAVQWNPYINWRWWDYPNSFLDNADGQWMELDQKYLYSGWDVKAIFSWSNRTDVCDGKSGGDSYDGPDDYLCMDLDFKVVDPNGNTKLISTSYSNNFEGGKFHTNVSGNYKFYVKRYRNSYEWTKKWPWSSKKYHKNRAKLGLAIAYITNE